MFSNRDAARGVAPRHAATSLIRIGVTLAALLAVTVSFAAWSSASTAKPSKATAAKKTLKISKAQCKADKAAGTINYISPFSYDASAGVVDVFWAQHENYFKDLCLNVNINAGVQSPQVYVAAGNAQISSTANAANVMGYVSSGDPLVGVETLANAPSLSVIIGGAGKTLKDVKSFGYYNNFNASYAAMFSKAGIPLSSIKIVKLTNRNPAQALQQVDAIATFVGSQDVILNEDKVPYSEITPANYGLKGTYTVYYMNSHWEASHKVAAQNFLRAQLKALQYCLVHTKPCVNYLGTVATQNNEGALYGPKQGSPVWAYSAKYIKAHKTQPLGVFGKGMWLPEYDLLKTYGPAANKISGLGNAAVHLPALTSMLNSKLISSLYSKGKLVWP